MPPNIKEIHPLTAKHVLGELAQRNLIVVDKFRNPIPVFVSLKHGEGTKIFAVNDQFG